jgi:hypothetical protein
MNLLLNCYYPNFDDVLANEMKILTAEPRFNLRRNSFLIALLFNFLNAQSQTYTLGWQGNDIIAESSFLNNSSWITGASSGESIYTTTDTNSLNIHWKFGTGNQFKYALCFQVLQNPVAITDSDMIGITVKGSVCNSNRNFSIKFEDGTNQALFTWQSLASVNRWCERLSMLKSQFGGTINWNHVVVITFVVSSDASQSDIQPDSGVVSVRNLMRSNIRSWQRAGKFETLAGGNQLDSVKNKVLEGILSRQVSNGLFYSWKEDNASWLYGHGLILKILSIEGTWQNNIPSNSYAIAAEKLAMFLINNQENEGYWPRAWNTSTGSIKFMDQTIWMGDFPWIITGLVNYYAKSGDESVLPAIQKARSFLYSLITPAGELYTLNTSTNSNEPVTSVEAYSAAINAVFELGDSVKAMGMINFISSLTWDSNLRYWEEGIYSTRPVLFANTWMSMLMYHSDDSAKAINALSFAGKALDTHGPGRPEGLDGIGPVATWYEGTLSYICAGGPGSRNLYDSLVKYRYSDGTIPAYNDTIGSKVEIWAVNWSSLDATAWLYFASAKKSPFIQYYHPVLPALLDPKSENPSLTVYPIPARDILFFSMTNDGEPVRSISLYDLKGTCLKKIIPESSTDLMSMNISPYSNGIYLLVIEFRNKRIYKKVEILR